MLSGHDTVWREWRAALDSPRMHHAWMLAGRRGSGKMTFALEAAHALIAQDGQDHPAQNHPDILVLTHLPSNSDEEKKRDEGKPYQTKRNISVDQIRRMQQRLTTRPTLGTRRAIIIDPADDMEKGASNALLKSLEEPPAGSYFLLVTHRPGKLLPTIRSRCRLLRFPQISDSEIDAILQKNAPQANPATRHAAIAAAGGSPGAALDFVEMNLAELHQLMVTILREGDRDYSLRGRLAGEMGARPDRLRQAAAIDLARSVLAGAVAEAPKAAMPVMIDAHSDLNRLAAQAPTYNFDAGLLVMEIGTLLASAAMPRD
ncbi:DNA polymerase III subunit delta' [Altericroceibacterium endophyticum]|uniref:DNA polymerase III subunit delta n=1 Tax=Altericroceibacterium endophyticum TaxID=1808508 RepID=A0A6I4T2X2_9SPHN|nr:DNA polymerase III subunit delta' [Altericroceibacterium endophyticum]MXO64519.1 DNA polymerase III subunit delta' [Altericroceibacterium endophyticum]